MGLMKTLKKRIDDAFAEGHRTAEQQSVIADMLKKYREILKKRKARKKKPEVSQETIAAEAEAKQAKLAEESKYAFVPSIGATEGAKIDADMKAQIPAGLMEHIDEAFDMYPATVIRWEGRYAILPLGNIVMGLLPNKKVVQIGPDKRDFTRKNLQVVGDCEPETSTTRTEMRQRYAERCKKCGKRFIHA